MASTTIPIPHPAARSGAAWLAAGAIAALAATSPALDAQQPPSPVRTAAVELRAVQRHDRVTGSLRPVHEAVVAALEEGALLEVLVDEAATVQKGDVLARTDARRIEAMLLESEADLARAEAEILQREAELKNAEEDVAAMEAAAADNAVSRRQLRLARTERDVAATRLTAAQKAVGAVQARAELLRVRRSDTTVRAPFDGHVTVRHAEPGEWVKAGDPIVTLVSSGVVEAWLEVPERYVEAARAWATELHVEVTATGSRRPLQKPRLVPQVHARARTFHLVGDVHEGGEQPLLPGMSISAWMPVSEPEPQLLVPRDAIVRRPGLVYVFAARTGPQGMVAEQVPVQVKFESPAGVAIDAGSRLQRGDLVVVEGNERLLPGAALLPVTAPAAPPSGGSGNAGGSGKAAGSDGGGEEASGGR